MGREQGITDELLKQKFPTQLTDHSVKQLMLVMRNWTGCLAEDVANYNVHNGVDAWRRLRHNQLPEVEHQKQQ